MRDALRRGRRVPGPAGRAAGGALRRREQGAQLIVQPTSWAHGLLKEHHWDVLVAARAIENTVYVAAADQLKSAGTMVVDPMGVAIARRGDTPGLLVAEVSPQRVAEVRHTLPSLSHVRPDLYDRWRRVPQPVG